MLAGHLWELMIVLGIALVIFGPKRLPDLGASLGKGIREFQGAVSGIGEPERHEVLAAPMVAVTQPLPHDEPVAAAFSAVER